MKIELQRKIDYVFSDIHSYLRKNSKDELGYHEHEALMRSAGIMQGTLKQLVMLAEIPETRAILKELLEEILADE